MGIQTTTICAVLFCFVFFCADLYVDWFLLLHVACLLSVSHCMFSHYARQYLSKIGGQLDKRMLYWQWQPAKCCIFQLFIIICYLANKVLLRRQYRWQLACLSRWVAVQWSVARLAPLVSPGRFEVWEQPEVRISSLLDVVKRSSLSRRRWWRAQIRFPTVCCLSTACRPSPQSSTAVVRRLRSFHSIHTVMLLIAVSYTGQWRRSVVKSEGSGSVRSFRSSHQTI